MLLPPLLIKFYEILFWLSLLFAFLILANAMPKTKKSENESEPLKLVLISNGCIQSAESRILI
jgi:hypothetical protein